MTRFCRVAFMICLAICSSLDAQAPATQAANTQPASRITATQSKSSDLPAITQHTLKLPAGDLAYTATTGFISLKDDSGKAQANLFYIAYTKPVNDSSSARPVTFCFNGGPGAASVWLHMGALGPRRIDFQPDGSLPPPPYRLVDNQYTWLTFTDLVFIDPVNTGYSRPAAGNNASQYHDVRGDVKAVAEFIRLYTTQNRRWDSPKFLAGESYGTTRAAALADYLQRDGLALNGVLLISTVLNFQTISISNANELPFPLFLPSYTAAAYHHKKLPADLLKKPLPDVLKEVESFTLTAYTTALAQGASLSDQDRKNIISSLTRFTGLSADYVEKSNLRIQPGRFQQALLGDSQSVIGRMDTRLIGFARDAANDAAQYDPAMDAYLMPYTSAFNTYVRNELQFESDVSYEVLSDRVWPWNFGTNPGHGGQGYLYVGDNLRDAITVNPNLKVFVASGLFDLATPYFASQYQIDHLGLPPYLQKNITHHHYLGGHMMYHVRTEIEKMTSDISNFYHNVLPKK